MICKKEICTACSACMNICPKNAIFMVEDDYGNIYPKIDKKKCIHCNLCKNTCPQLNKKLVLNSPIKVYAMYCKDSKKREESTSGGAATIFYEYILDNNGVVYGASNLFEKPSFDFIRIDKKSELYKVKGSKYVHCYINDSFKKVKEDLLSNKYVLFIGTPCQVSGLKSFLKKDFDKLITIDIICHGVPSQKLLFDELDKQKIDKNMVKSVFFRDNKGFNMKVISNDNNIIYYNSSNNVDYFKNFLQGNFYRENCYTCRYAQRKRISDITIGDFWGLSKHSKIYDDERKGISVILANTEAGIKLLNSVVNECIIEERTISEALKHNEQLNHPMIKTNAYYIYLKYYPQIGYKKTMMKMLTNSEKMKRILKKSKLVNMIYNKIKQF